MEIERTDEREQIRSYQPSDLDACRALWMELTQWHREIYDSQEIGGADPGLQFDEHLRKVGPDLIWIATIGEDTVGLAGMIAGESEYELEPLIVRTEYRNRGLGTKLANVVIEKARKNGARKIGVKPAARNQYAIQFFQELGFNILGQVELLKELDPSRQKEWREGEQIAGREFKI